MLTDLKDVFWFFFVVVEGQHAAGSFRLWTRFEDTLCFCFVFMSDSFLHFVTVPGCCWCRRMPNFWSRVEANLTMEHRASAGITSGRTSYSIQASDLHQPQSSRKSSALVIILFSVVFQLFFFKVSSESPPPAKHLEQLVQAELERSWNMLDSWTAGRVQILSFISKDHLCTHRFCFYVCGMIIQHPESLTWLQETRS